MQIGKENKGWLQLKMGKSEFDWGGCLAIAVPVAVGLALLVALLIAMVISRSS